MDSWANENENLKIHVQLETSENVEIDIVQIPSESSKRTEMNMVGKCSKSGPHQNFGHRKLKRLDSRRVKNTAKTHNNGKKMYDSVSTKIDRPSQYMGLY